MPYDPSKLGSPAPAPAPAAEPVAAGSDSDPPNPFFQFIDPSAHRRLVQGALGRTEAGRLITPLSRVRQRKAGSQGLGSAWDEELADDAA